SHIYPQDRLISLYSGNYQILVIPDAFLDIVINPYISLALFAPNGELIAARNNPDLDFAKQYLFGKGKPVSGKYMISMRQGNKIYAVTMEPKAHFYEILGTQRYLMIPVGLMMSFIIIAIIVYFSRRSLSVAGELKYAIETNKLVVWYQPI